MSSLSVVSRRLKEVLAEAAVEKVTRSNREVTEAGVARLDSVMRLQVNNSFNFVIKSVYSCSMCPESSIQERCVICSFKTT